MVTHGPDQNTAGHSIAWSEFSPGHHLAGDNVMNCNIAPVCHPVKFQTTQYYFAKMQKLHQNGD